MGAADGPAQKYGRLLRRVVFDRGVLLVDVARAIDVGPQSVSDWVNGKKLPELSSAAALADVLDNDHLWRYMETLRSKRCRCCDRAFVDGGKSVTAKYCSTRCAKRHDARKRRGTMPSKYKVALSDLMLHREAVAAYCHGCEPAGLCLTTECPLRDVSPLPATRVQDVSPISRRPSDKMMAYIKRRYVA